jgi:hypothetical protein
MPPKRTETANHHPRESSLFTLLSGWGQQGIESFFAAQRVLVDLAMRQNASLMHALRHRLTDPHNSPTALLGEVTAESVSNFIEAQKILLQMGQKQNEILMTGVKERVGDWPAAQAMSELFQRSIDTFIQMQQEFLKIADKQNHAFVTAAKTGKPVETEHLMEVTRDLMEQFFKAQKHFMDIVADEMVKATSGKAMKKGKKMEFAQLARHTTESFIDAQKKLVDLFGKQMDVGMKSAGKTIDMLRPFPFLPLAELTRQGVKSYVDVQKELMTFMHKPPEHHKPMKHPKTRKRTAKTHVATAAVA